MKIKIEQLHRQLFAKQVKPDEKLEGVLSVSQSDETHEFTIRIMKTNRLSYQYDPVKKKFEVSFISLEQTSEVNNEGRQSQY